MICNCCESRIDGGGLLPNLPSQDFWSFEDSWWVGKSMRLEARQTWAWTPALALTSLWAQADQLSEGQYEACPSDLFWIFNEMPNGKGLERVLSKCQFPLVPLYQCPYFTLLSPWFSFLSIIFLVRISSECQAKKNGAQGTNTMSVPLPLHGGNISQK